MNDNDDLEPTTTSVSENGTTAAEPMKTPDHSDAGRRAAKRVKHLIRLGQLFEEEHGLKRGRQRLRQLIEEGKSYEKEHGLVQPTKRRPRRAKAWANFIQALADVARPAYRRQIEQLLTLSDTSGNGRHHAD